MSDNKKETTLSLYANLLLRMKNLILSPREEWHTIHKLKKNTNEVLTEFSLPLIAMVSIATFLNYILNYQEVNFELAIKQATIAFTALFGGLYISYFIVRVLLKKCNFSNDSNHAFRIVGYASGLWYLITLIVSIIPELVLLHITSFYTFYIIWTTIDDTLGIKKNKKIIITVFIGIIIHFIPYFVKYSLLKLIYF